MDRPEATQDPALPLLRRAPLWLGLIIFGCCVARLLTGAWWFVLPPTLHLGGYGQALYATAALAWVAARTHPRSPLERPLGPAEPALLLILGLLLMPLSRNSLGAGLGLAACLLLGYQALRASGVKRTRYFGYLSVAVLLPLYPGCIGPLMEVFIDRVTPRVFDLRSWQLDGIVGSEPAFAVLRFLHHWPLLSSLLTAVYNAMPLMVILAVLMGLHRAHRVYFDVTGALIVGGVAGVLLYLLYPAAGTRFLCHVYHLSYPPPLHAHFFGAGMPPLLLAAPDVWRNCTPSLHVLWGLVCLFALCRHSRGAASLAICFAVLTLVAALAVGEHWWNDMISSFPLALWAVAATTLPRADNLRARRACALGGLVVGVGWIALQRWGQSLLLAVPVLTLTAQGTLVVGSLVAESWLARCSGVDWRLKTRAMAMT